MSKRLIIILALALVVGVTCAAYAEVQNVKVSGDITVMGVARNNFDLATSGTGTEAFTTSQVFGKERDLLSITRIRVDADLTDNVSTTVRLLNERNWNGESYNGGDNNYNVLSQSNNNAENQLDLDLAYVTMKEFLYSPLTMKVGRQELRFGSGLIVGDPDTNQYSLATSLAEGDLSARKSFDAIRATLDYNPLVIDAVFAKLVEHHVQMNDDTTLAGVNAAYDMGRNTMLEGYFFSKVKGSEAPAVWNIDAGNRTSFDRNVAGATNTIKNVSDKVFTVGARAVNKSVKNLTVGVEGALQFGTYNPKFDPNAAYSSAGTVKRAETSNRRAFAIQADVAYDLKEITQLTKYSPVISANYTYLSGADRNKVGDKKYKGWDPMFEDQTIGHVMNAIFGNTNMSRGSFSAKGKLTDDIGLKIDYVLAYLARKIPEGRLVSLSGIGIDDAATAADSSRTFRMGGKSYLGQEVDATITYDYTEDVQFSLLGGMFMPSSNINDGYVLDSNGNPATQTQTRHNTPAGELIGSMKVSF